MKKKLNKSQKQKYLDPVSAVQCADDKKRRESVRQKQQVEENEENKAKCI